MQLNIPRAAELLRTSESQVRRWIREAGLPAVVFDEQYRLNRTDLIAWAQSNQIPVIDPAPPHRAPELELALARGGIHRGLEGGNGAELLANLLARVDLPPDVDLDLVREMVLCRGDLALSPIGRGIVGPHARYPNLVPIDDAVVALGFPARPVCLFASPETALLALFAIVTDTARSHVALVAHLGAFVSSRFWPTPIERASDAEILSATRRFHASGTVPASRADGALP